MSSVSAPPAAPASSTERRFVLNLLAPRRGQLVCVGTFELGGEAGKGVEALLDKGSIKAGQSISCMIDEYHGVQTK